MATFLSSLAVLHQAGKSTPGLFGRGSKKGGQSQKITRYQRTQSGNGGLVVGTDSQVRGTGGLLLVEGKGCFTMMPSP